MQYDVIIIGAGAAGLMCAIEAGKRGRRVCIMDHAKAVGEKIRISGGGRCNFTNFHTSPANYLSKNPRFCVSALARYTPADFIKLIEKHHIAYHEKTLGQLFCDGSSMQIIRMLLAECAAVNVSIMLNTSILAVTKQADHFVVACHDDQRCHAESLVIATGGLSIPKMGATGLGYDIAKQFGLTIIDPSPALVPFTVEETWLQTLRPLAGVSLDVIATIGGVRFQEGMLFTHRGLSGPAILQLSSYWQEQAYITLNLAPTIDVLAMLKQARQDTPKQEIHTAIARFIPKKLAQFLCAHHQYEGQLSDCSNATLEHIAASVNRWTVLPNGTEGFRTAEVTLGGVDTQQLSSKTFAATKVSGLYFIGEVIDVTGHLGGFNFQWAWASGHAAGQYV
jgi:predicted Rossmann fold flavoprotein